MINIVLSDTAFKLKIEAPREPPIGLSTIASFMRLKDYSVKVISPTLENWSIRKTAREIYKINPEVLGLSVIDVNAVNAMKLVEYLRKLGYKGFIVLGGYWATLSSHKILETFSQVDACVRGEGEYTFYELVKALGSGKDFKCIRGLSYRDGGNIIENENRPLVNNLDDFPLPARDYTERVINMDSAPAIYTGKGCHGQCSFCSINAFYEHCSGDKIRTRSPANVVTEMEILIKNFELPYFTIVDDNFIMPGKKGAEYIEEFKQEIESRKLKLQFDLMCRVDLIDEELFRKLKSIGLRRVFLGVESGHENGLKRFNKKITVEKSLKAIATLQNLGLEFTVALILADPWTNYEEFETNLNFMKKIRNTFDKDKLILSVSPKIVVHKYTAIYERLKTEGRLLGDWFKGYTYELNPDIRVPLMLWELLTGKWPSFFRKLILKIQTS
ncbi:B12-binding domain-containing radical SAM protein [candidate division KSB1 bacterium]